MLQACRVKAHRKGGEKPTETTLQGPAGIIVVTQTTDGTGAWLLCPATAEKAQ